MQNHKLEKKKKANMCIVLLSKWSASWSVRSWGFLAGGPYYSDAHVTALASQAG